MKLDREFPDAPKESYWRRRFMREGGQFQVLLGLAVVLGALAVGIRGLALLANHPLPSGGFTDPAPDATPLTASFALGAVPLALVAIRGGWAATKMRSHRRALQGAFAMALCPVFLAGVEAWTWFLSVFGVVHLVSVWNAKDQFPTG